MPKLQRQHGTRRPKGIKAYRTKCGSVYYIYPGGSFACLTQEYEQEDSEYWLTRTQGALPAPIHDWVLKSTPIL